MDQTSGFANKHKLYIDIHQATIEKSVRFKAILTKFNDQYDTIIESEDQYGATEEIKSYKKVNRKIDLSWDIVASSKDEAKENMQRVSALLQMLYPLKTIGPYGNEYVSADGFPIFRLRFLNLVGESSLAHAAAKDSGLIGFLDNVSYDINMDSGFFQEKGKVFPQYVAFNATFWAQHPFSPPSWIVSESDKSGVAFNVKSFPYGVKPKFSHEGKVDVNTDGAEVSDYESVTPGSANDALRKKAQGTLTNPQN